MNEKLIGVERAMNSQLQHQLSQFNRGRQVVRLLALTLPTFGIITTAMGWLDVMYALSHFYCGSIFHLIARMFTSSELPLFIAAVFLVSLAFWDLMVRQLELQMKMAVNETMACLIGVEARNGRL